MLIFILIFMWIYRCMYHILYLIKIVHHKRHHFMTRTTSKHEMVQCWYKKMSVPSFSDFIKLSKSPCTSTWVSPLRRGGGRGDPNSVLNMGYLGKAQSFSRADSCSLTASAPLNDGLGQNHSATRPVWPISQIDLSLLCSNVCEYPAIGENFLSVDVRVIHLL